MDAIVATSATAAGRLFFWRKVVRDLLWSITSPHMLDDEAYPVLPADFGLNALQHRCVIDWLNGLQADPSHLIVFLHATTRTKSTQMRQLALGVYFSALLQYWLTYCPLFHVEKFETGKQIVSATNQTVGQLKFLFRLTDTEKNTCEDNCGFRDFHVESSVKFFLLHPIEETDAKLAAPNNTAQPATPLPISIERAICPLEQFVGPHLGENLAWRVQEVARKLDMCQGESVQAWLRANYSDHVASHIVLRGYLFYPLSYFASTSQVTQGHDWQPFHPNSTALMNEQLVHRHNPRISTNHLRGWWTSDYEIEFTKAVLANDREDVGESRFIVLPKLHWLSPVLATEDPVTRRIAIEGEKELGIEDVEVLTLEEVVAYATHHFRTLATSTEAHARGGVVMPLLVSEIVRCKPRDTEFDEKITRWKELSRGFLLDPTCWDPLPLCHDAVRFRRTNNRDNLEMVSEREYEGRRAWVQDGVIKPSDDELSQKLESKWHSFTNPGTIGPRELTSELLGILKAEQKAYTHANLKQSVRQVLLSRNSDTVENTCYAQGFGALATYALQCFELLILDNEFNDESKLVQRVGHLILDAFEGLQAQCEQQEEVNKTPWLLFFLRVAEDEYRWDFLNLALRASDLIARFTKTNWNTGTTEQRIERILDRLLAQDNVRWNAIVVEMIRIFRVVTYDASESSKNETEKKNKAVFDILIARKDWKSAEHMVTFSNNLEMFQILFQYLWEINASKALKRLKKVYSHMTSAGPTDITDVNGDDSRINGISLEALGPPIDHVRNRVITRQTGSRVLQWTYVDSLSQINDVVELLARLESEIRTHKGLTEHELRQKMIVGLDCEWRPQFLVNASNITSASISSSTSCMVDVVNTGEEDDDAIVGENDGLSVYQLAIDDHVFVIDVQLLGELAAKPLRFIWKPQSCFVLVGFCVTSDVKRLNHSFPSLLAPDTSQQQRINLLVELKQLALYRHIPASKWGLSRLCFECLGEKVDKEQQCSDWGMRPLSKSQIEYAAKDAYAVQNITLHLLANVTFLLASSLNEQPYECVIEYIKRFAVVTGPSTSSFGHWISKPQALGKDDVFHALKKLGLLDSAVSFHTIGKGSWDGNVHCREGLLVKTIAIVIRRAQKKVRYVAVVLQLDRSINMDALADFIGVKTDELLLADRQTLVRVFGYQRGCVGPIGLRQKHTIEIIVDEGLLAEHRLLCGAGAQDEVYAIAPDVLIRAVNAQITVVS